MPFRLLGAGSPLVDYSVRVDDAFLAAFVSGGKGGTLNISDAERAELTGHFPEVPDRFAGGAAANTVMAAAEMGVDAALLGKTGNDADGRFFRQAMREAGAGDSELRCDAVKSTGYCLTLVTPDAERTMRSNLGASLNIDADDARKTDFAAFSWLLMEGYFIGTDFLDAAVRCAKSGNCKVALDLCSYELAHKYRKKFTEVICGYTDLLFANFDEAAALTEADSEEAIAGKLAKFPAVCVLKLGAAGSLIIAGDDRFRIPPVAVTDAIDTTAAGDYYAAGFFYGLSRGMSWEQCGRAGSLTASAIVRVPGTKLDKNSWKQLNTALEKLV